jgi:peptidoglycan/xylan/chitin deacetylase (PgdA/CDA1 family)
MITVELAGHRMRKYIVCLSFDFDAFSIWISRGMTTPLPLSRGEFCLVGAQRILALLKVFDIKATWFIPGHTMETFPEECRAIHRAGHEIGNHGWTHRSPLEMSRDEEQNELQRANETLKKLTGYYATGYRSPVWDSTPNTVDLLLDAGFLYASNGMANDHTPYRARVGDVITMFEPAILGRTTPLIEMPVSWSLDDAPHFEVVRTPNWIQPGLSNASLVADNWIADFDYMQKHEEWGVLTYTFHPYCIGRGHRMMALEKLISHLHDRGAVFMTMDEAAREFDAREPYVSGGKGQIVSNHGAVRS